MYDDTSEGVLKVFISDLTTDDEATYRCGVNITDDDDPFTEIKLTVNQDHQFSTPNKSAAVIGESVKLTCNYPEKHNETIKHICKENNKKICQNISSSEKKRFEFSDSTAGVFTVIISNMKIMLKKPKISVKDDTELNLFTVTMTDLRAEDAGKYWCAVKDVFNLPIELMIVMKDVITHEASVGGSASISCKYIRNQNQGFFCRGDQPNICVRDGVCVSSKSSKNGRFSLTDETSAGVFTVIINNLRAEDSGKYWCGEENSGSFILTEVQLHVKGGFSVIVAVSVGLILLALVIVLILFKLKHNKRDICFVHTGIISSTDRRQRGDHETAQEQIQDARHHSDTDPESTPLYSIVQLPTNLSDLQNPLYSTVQLPTIPSDELLYSSISFQKHEDSLSDATVKFSKEENCCDYASVSYSTTPK
ncbi:hypothetical protein M9458_052828 [Cirrhinus mrigala]|uniref:Polymeric immunoglobulin receptor-like n=1 Tax=Cirrhinus mrigala TaxID=683832 RepID=A0ABD0MSS7_CIRMR